MSDDTYYDELGVEPDASRDELRAAYRERVADLEAAREKKGVTDVAAAGATASEVARVRAAWNVLVRPVPAPALRRRSSAGAGGRRRRRARRRRRRRRAGGDRAAAHRLAQAAGAAAARSSGDRRRRERQRQGRAAADERPRPEPTIALPPGMQLAEPRARGMALLFDIAILLRHLHRGQPARAPGLIQSDYQRHPGPDRPGQRRSTTRRTTSTTRSKAIDDAEDRERPEVGAERPEERAEGLRRRAEGRRRREAGADATSTARRSSSRTRRRRPRRRASRARPATSSRRDPACSALLYLVPDRPRSRAARSACAAARSGSCASTARRSAGTRRSSRFVVPLAARARDPAARRRCSVSASSAVGLPRPERPGHPRQARPDARRRRVVSKLRPHAQSDREISDAVRVRLRGGLEGAEVPARRQGREPRRDDEARPARAARLHDHDRRVQGLHGRRRHDPRRPHGRGRRGARRARGEDGQAARRRRRPAARVGALGRAVLDAGDDGHRPQPRAQRHVGAAASRSRPTTSASPTTRTAASCRCSARSCSTSTASKFEHALERAARASAASRPTPSSRADDLRGLVETVQGDRARRGGHRVPAGPARSSCGYAIEAVFRSWNGERARDLPPDGEDPRRPRHRGQRADDGVRQQGRRLRHRRRVHPRPRDRREPRPTATSSRNAQGEDVVAGIRATEPLDAMGNDFPECHPQLLERDADRSQSHYRDMCDIEFTIEQGRLFILQTRVGKRTAAAALRMAVEMEEEGLIDKREAVLRVQPAQLDQLLHPQFDPTATYAALTKGLNASPGAAVGKVVLHRRRRRARTTTPAKHVILVRPETSPDDLHGMIAAEGILTSRGGLVSHAAVVARGMGTPAVCGADALDIDVERRRVPASTATTVARGRRHLDQRHHRRGRHRRGAGRHARADRSVRDRPRLGRRVPRA